MTQANSTEVQGLVNGTADLRALGRLIGSWSLADPTGQDAVEGRVRFEWLAGGHFLVQHVDLDHRGHHVTGIEVIGHERPFGAEEAGPDLISRFYDSEGNTLDYVYELEDDVLTIWGGQKGSPAYFRGTFGDDGDSLVGAWVWPGGGYDVAMTRVDG